MHTLVDMFMDSQMNDEQEKCEFYPENEWEDLRADRDMEEK